jgi:hypothetical protein
MIRTKTMLVDGKLFHATDLTGLSIAEYGVENARVFEADEAVSYVRTAGSGEVLLLKDGALVKRTNGRIVKTETQDRKMNWAELFTQFAAGMEVYQEWQDKDDAIEDARAKLYEQLEDLAKQQDRNSNWAVSVLDARLPNWRTMLKLPEDDDD